MIGYEREYHTLRHAHYSDSNYYRARAEIAVHVYFRDVPPDAVVFEYGCGFGQNISLLCNAIGYDVSRFALEQCRIHGVRATDRLMDIADNSIDVAFSAHVLEHHPEPSRMLQEIRSKLRPHGKLILVIPYERGGRVALDPDLDQHLYSWTFRTINNLLAFAGYRVCSNRYSYGWGYQKALPVRRLGLRAYQAVTMAIGYIFGAKELVVVAEPDSERISA